MARQGDTVPMPAIQPYVHPFWKTWQMERVDLVRDRTQSFTFDRFPVGIELGGRDGDKPAASLQIIHTEDSGLHEYLLVDPKTFRPGQEDSIYYCIPDNGQPLTVGRRRTADLTGGTDISRDHFTVSRRGEEFTLTDLSSNGTSLEFLARVPVNEPE